MDTLALAQNMSGVIEPLGLECLGVEWLPAGAHSCLRVYIDRLQRDRDVDVDDCATASTELSAWLDVEDPIKGTYSLEVSSPGLDRLLFTPAQVAEALGETVKIKLRIARDGSRKLQGRVLAVEGSLIRLDVAGQGELDVDFADIESARVEPDWAALGLASASGKSGRGHKGKTGRTQRHAGRS